VGFRILVVGTISDDDRRDLAHIGRGSELLDADGPRDMNAWIRASAPHLLVIGDGAIPIDPAALEDVVPPLPVLTTGTRRDADLHLAHAAEDRESVLRSAKKLAEMRRALLAAVNAAAEADAAAVRRVLETLDNEFLRAMRYRHPLSLVLSSIDDLSALIHDYGREPVEAFVDLLRSSLRRSLRHVDLLLCTSGEEIAVLLPDTPAAGARIVAERMRMQARRLLFKPPASGDRPSLPIKVTSSVGIVDAPREGLRSGADFLACARAAVAQARSTREERAVVHGELSLER
jgi:diguanylate cyclase (GGDEF)-like protein